MLKTHNKKKPTACFVHQPCTHSSGNDLDGIYVRLWLENIKHKEKKVI
jgi:hypothetical protein